MSDPLQQVIALLGLEKIDENLYRGQSEATDWGRVYGGQVIAQALSAAAQQVDPERHIHSFHSYFLRPGNPDYPIIFEVESNLDAGTISNRRVKAVQRGQTIFFMTSSFQLNIDSFDHQSEMPDVPPPENLPKEMELSAEAIRLTPEEWLPKFNAVRAIDFRAVGHDDPSMPINHKRMWMKPNGPLPNNPCVHNYLLAYASDFCFLSTASHPHNVSFMTEDMRMATIDHSMWYHRPFDFNDWLLYDMDSPSASNGRGFVRGKIYDRAGRLVASSTQEGIMRKKRGS
ncbi:acyl-CoA thioesterase II [gamma proteobacterium BDW918]|jgi:acyl-CoA thioesterase-2|uniref:Acyl-CoA thioesterase 2 n=1 Tax=Zhongshania aliphaticivorans TaxID=1470434 RepID=A0A127M718_9GAMM|nr:acyl-CoA thioesterase II [Zhongshania aliphaticivorans]AMO69027.1 acyl-CoA thioesterase II [Zhongshania aliphaticivorans]EIF43711.1 acyl-CoA thioesterase II [gamma proteobacterium BDW918]